MYNSDLNTRPIWANNDFGCIMLSRSGLCSIVRVFAHRVLDDADELLHLCTPGTRVAIFSPGTTNPDWSYTVPEGGR